MSDALPDLLGSLEPGGQADEFVRAALPALVRLAELLESTRWDTQRIRDLEQKIDTLNEKLDNFVKVLASLPTSD